VTFDDQFSKAVEGEASWKTSDFDQAADRYDIDFSPGVRDVVVDTLELKVARAPAAAGHGAVHRHRRVHRTSLWVPGGRSWVLSCEFTGGSSAAMIGA
jgi:hypothetical protein